MWNPATAEYLDYMRIGNCNMDVCPAGRETKSELLLDVFPERINFWLELNKKLDVKSVRTTKVKRETSKDQSEFNKKDEL